MPLNDYLPAAVVGATAAIGYGELRMRAKVLGRDVDAKASKDVVDTQYNEIIRRLDRIENTAERIRTSHRIGDD